MGPSVYPEIYMTILGTPNGRTTVRVMPRLKTGDVIALSSDEGSELDESRSVAKLLHGVQTTLQYVKNAKELLAFLSQYRSVHRLVFMFHGSPGELRIGEDVKSLPQLSAILKKEDLPLRCDELVFEGCNIAQDGPAMVDLMEQVQANSASGYAAYHGWAVLREMSIPKGILAEEVEKAAAYRQISRFMIPGQPTAAQMARRPGKYRIAVEYFDNAPPDPDLFDGFHSGSVARLRDRSQIQKRSFSMQDAAQTKQWNTILGGLVQVTIRR